MKKGLPYFVRAVVAGVMLSQTFPVVEKMEQLLKREADSPIAGMGRVVWILGFVIALINLVVMIQSMLRFIVEMKREKNMGDEAATETIEQTLKKTLLILVAFIQTVFGVVFVVLGGIAIFAPREMTGGESLAGVGGMFVVVGGLWAGIAIWKTVKGWKK